MYTCAQCGREFDTEPVRDESQVWFVGVNAAQTFCTVECLERAAEHWAQAMDEGRY